MNLRNRLPFLLYASKYQDLIVEGADKLDLQDALKDWLYYVNAYGKSVQSNVPYDYRELEYIESTGTQYIDTGIVPDETVDLDLLGIDLTQTSGSVRFGSRVAQNNSAFAIITTSGNKVRFDYGDISSNEFNFNGNYDRITFNHTTLTATVYRNGVVLDSITSPQSVFNSTYNLYLFAFNSGGQILSASGYKVRYCKLWKSGNLVRNFVPCKNASGVVGMYDTVSGQFFGNAGTGEFIAGPEVVTSLPSPCVRIDYVDMQAGSYVLTNIIPKSDYNIEIDFKTTTVQSQNTCYFGARSTTSSGSGISAAHTNTREYVFDVFGQRFSPTQTFANDTRYLYSYNNGTVSLSSGGSILYTNTTTPTDIVTHPFIINALNNIGTAYGNYEGIYLYSFKVRDNTGKLIADYVPARIDARAVLYDRVTNQTIMQDTGTWEPGPDTTITYISTPDKPIDIWCNNGVLRASINEFDENAVTNGYFYNADLEWVANSSVYTTDYMKTVKGKYTLVLSNTATVTSPVNIRVNLFNANKEIQSQTIIPITADTTEFTYEVDIPNGISYVRISTNPTFVAVSGFSNSKTIYTDGVVETLQLTGKNLFDYSIGLQLGGDPTVIWTMESGGVTFALNQATGLYTVSGLATGTGGRNTLRTQTFYLPAGTYTISATNSPVINILLVNETTGNTIAQTQSTTTFTLTETTPLHFGLSRTPGITYNDSFYLQIEKGSTATTYEPYYDGGTATAEMLLSLGDYTDEQEIISGVVTRKLGVKVLDGTEDWGMGTSGRFRLSGAFPDLKDLTDNNIGYSTHFTCFPTSASIQSLIPNNCFGWNTSFVLVIRDNRFDNANDFKAWLAQQYAAGTPVIIVYPLATPTTSIIPEQPLQLENGNNVLQIIEASLNDLKLEAKYRKRK